ncbi:site-specific integrase [Chromohalobacter sp. 48-RD10]|uniref:site-specific integrase n=1 Tax=Chromohalobacter sp. 48-RD10 TaxID=2994063 RepID=UPI0024694EA5|nr:site-specific integrase [Chromohalobacter sp. 48-RD10]
MKRYSPRTVKTYCYWIHYLIRFNGLRHLASMGGSEVKAFLEHLAVQRHVAAATQNQASEALFLLSAVLREALPAYVAHWAEAWTWAFSHATAPTCACGDERLPSKR